MAPPKKRVAVKQLSKSEKNKNYRISNRWILSDDKSITAAYIQGKVAMSIGNLKEELGRFKNLITMEELDAVAFLDKWGEIHTAYTNKTSIQITLTSAAALPTTITLTSAAAALPTTIALDYGFFPDNPNQYGMKLTQGKWDVPMQLLTLEDLEKITRYRCFIMEHVKFLQANYACYKAMVYVILNYITRMDKGVGKHTIAESMEDITAYNLKHDIIAEFKKSCIQKKLDCTINQYALFTYCLTQGITLSRNWRVITFDYVVEDEDEEEEEEGY
jgi:hypothetical protein